MSEIPAGWYDDQNGGPRRYWNGTAWADQVMDRSDLGRWEQAPDGTWHRLSWWSRYGVVVAVVAIIAAGGAYVAFQIDAEQQRQQDTTDELMCGIVGDC